MSSVNKNQSFWQRLGFALNGFSHALRQERSLQTQLTVLVLVVLALLFLRPAAIWWALVSLCCAAVLAAELFNTAIEHLADHLHPDQHPSIRIVKDCAAAAVLCAALGAAGVGVALAVEVIAHWR